MRELVQQAQRNLGSEHPIRLLLADRGFLDGQTLWTLKHDLHIDWIVPVRTNMDLAADARQIATQTPDDVYVTAASRPPTGPRERGQVTLTRRVRVDHFQHLRRRRPPADP